MVKLAVTVFIAIGVHVCLDILKQILIAIGRRRDLLKLKLTNQLTMKTLKTNLTNRNAQPEGRALSVTGFDGPYRVDSILTYLASRLQPCCLSVDLAVSIRVAVPCKMISKVDSIIVSA